MTPDTGTTATSASPTGAVQPVGAMLPAGALPGPATAPAEHGLFLTFEGGDAAGKSTQLRMLVEHLTAVRGIDSARVLTTREPGGTDLGRSIRELLLHGDHVDPRAEALLYAADRAHHVEQTIRPHLASGGIVLSDRYLDSSVAYQGAGRALDPAQIRALSVWATGGLLPHRTILLDLAPEALATRREAGSLDRLERAGAAFHEAVRQEFLALAAAEPERWAVVDASGTPDEVHAAVIAALAPQLDALAASARGAARAQESAR